MTVSGHKILLLLVDSYHFSFLQVKVYTVTATCVKEEED